MYVSFIPQKKDSLDDDTIVPLRISKRQKATLVAIVSFGVLVIVAALVRFVRSKPIFTERDHTCTSRNSPPPVFSLHPRVSILSTDL